MAEAQSDLKSIDKCNVLFHNGHYGAYLRIREVSSLSKNNSFDAGNIKFIPDLDNRIPFSFLCKKICQSKIKPPIKRKIPSFACNHRNSLHFVLTCKLFRRMFSFCYLLFFLAGPFVRFEQIVIALNQREIFTCVKMSEYFFFSGRRNNSAARMAQAV